MGAGQSTENIQNQKTLSSTIDYLAANYILTSNFQDLKNLTDPKYCKNLIVLTSEVIDKYLSNSEVEFLKQRMEGTIEKNEMTKEQLAYFNKESLDKMDVKSDLKKKRMCIGIAKYYVQIFHIFNAIAHTINPTYSWKDQYGSTITVDYEHRSEIPKNVEPTLTKVNLCNSRINSLMKDKTPLQNLSNNKLNDIINISSNFCTLNKTKEGNNKILANEPGIPELETLYFDVYDYNTGQFSSMSENMKNKYKNDLQLFYSLFTGKKNIPDNITKFGQIPLRDFKDVEMCKNNGLFRQSYKGNLNEKLFKEYVENVQNMISNTENNQKKLLEIIDQLFVFIINPQDPNKKMVVINPKLNNDLLSKLVAETRQNIFNLYTKCEEDFYKGLQIFESIVEKQVIDTSEEQIKNLEKQIEETITLNPNPNANANANVNVNTVAQPAAAPAAAPAQPPAAQPAVPPAAAQPAAQPAAAQPAAQPAAVV